MGSVEQVTWNIIGEWIGSKYFNEVINYYIEKKNLNISNFDASANPTEANLDKKLNY